MKKRIFALLVAAVLLIPAFAVPAKAEGPAVLYRRDATADANTNKAAWVSNSNSYWVQTCTTEHLGKLYQACMYNNRSASGTGLPEGENMQIILPELNIPTAGYGAVNMSIQYAYCPGNSDLHMGDNLVGYFELYASTDGGESWSEEHVGLLAQGKLDTGVTNNDLDATIFIVETEDFSHLVPDGAVINAIKLRPYGDWIYHYGATRIQWIEIDGWSEEQAAEIFAPIPMEEQTLRDIVASRACRTATLPWTCPVDVETRSPRDEESMAINYRTGFPYEGPCYTRFNFTTWERFSSCVVDGVYVGGTDYLSTEGMDCIRFVDDAIYAVTPIRRNNWKHLLWSPAQTLLGGLEQQMGVYTDEAVNGIEPQTLYEAYALLELGDYAAKHYPVTGASEDYAWHIRVITKPTKVVRKSDGTIDPAKSYAYFDEITSAMETFWRTPEGQTVRWEGRDPAAYQAEHPDYVCTLCRACRHQYAYSFSSLRSAKYLPYTLSEYVAAAVPREQLRCALFADGENVCQRGFAPIYSSNYHMVRLDTKLTDTKSGKVVWQEQKLFDPNTREVSYRNEELDALLAGLTGGSYLLTADVTAGPVLEEEGFQPVQRAVELAITVSAPGDLSGDGKVNAKDVVLLQRAVAGGYGVTLGGEADLNGDGKTNGKDVVLLQRFVAGGYGVTLV